VSADTATEADRPPPTRVPAFRVVPPVVWGRAWRIVERNALAYRRLGLVFAAGMLEPILYLFSIGLGVGALVGDLPTPGGGTVPYEVFVAPGLLAAAAMNGAIFDSTFNFFVKFKYFKTYDAILASPLSPADAAAGEILWSLIRGVAYSAVFLLTMAVLGYTESWWALAALPTTVLIGAAFASVGLAATTYMRSFVDFDYVNLVIIPSFLFSATFFPLSRYPDAVQVIVRLTPLYQGVRLCRAFTLGEVDAGLIFPVVYLLVMTVGGMAVAARRLRRLLQP
jgi:lipooligosaccharide transport system permease protein